MKAPTRVSDIFTRLLLVFASEDRERLVIEEEPSLEVATDAEYIHVMLENIVENALRFSPAYNNVELRAFAHGADTYIRVQDYCRGKPTDKRERVFEPFMRLEDMMHHSRGMGLGVHIVQLLASRLGTNRR